VKRDRGVRATWMKSQTWEFDDVEVDEFKQWNDNLENQE
jgi:hypothetical protein